jgi:hypothetical protein
LVLLASALASVSGIGAGADVILGKILQDAATVASLKIKEKDFLVVMVSKVGSGFHAIQSGL